ncbi:hypothetical protein D3C71_1683050 [compost metagenome]
MHDHVAACGTAGDRRGPGLGGRIAAVDGAHPAQRTIGIAKHRADVVEGTQRGARVDDVPAGTDGDGTTTVVPGAGDIGGDPVVEDAVLGIDHAAAAQPDQVAVERVVARRRLAHVHVTGRGRRSKGEQRIELQGAVGAAA